MPTLRATWIVEWRRVRMDGGEENADDLKIPGSGKGFRIQQSQTSEHIRAPAYAVGTTYHLEVNVILTSGSNVLEREPSKSNGIDTTAASSTNLLISCFFFLQDWMPRTWPSDDPVEILSILCL